MEFVSWQLAYLEIINDSICVIIIDTTLKWWITNSGEKMINLCENNCLPLIFDNFNKLDKHYHHGKVIFIYFLV